MGCLRFCYILIPAFFTIAAAVLGALSCAGSAKNNSLLTNIYFIDLDFSEMNATLILSSSGASSEITSLVESVESSESVNQALGLSDVYSFGMWGYCKGDLKDDETLANYDTSSVDYTYCSSPKAMYIFDPASVIASDITGENSTSTSDVISALTSAGVTLPSAVEDYMKVVTPLSKMIFICTLVGLALLFVQVVLSLVTVCSKTVSCFVFFLSILASVSLLLACAASTGAFLYIKKEFNNSVSEYGISAHLSRNYLTFYWIGVAASLAATFFWMFSVCCCSTGPFFGSGRRNVYVERDMSEKL